MATRDVLTPQMCEALLIKASGYDGRDTGGAAVIAWHEAAVAQRWTDFQLAMDAIVDYYSRPAKQGERLWIMPGHVTEYIRAQYRQPERYDRNAIEGPPASAYDSPAKRAALEEIRKFAKRTTMPKPLESDGQSEEERQRVRAELNRRKWAAVDACSNCDHEGMIVGTAVVCDHSTAKGSAA